MIFDKLILSYILISFALIYIGINLLKKYNFYDKPNESSKDHLKPTITALGIPIVIAFMCCVAITYYQELTIFSNFKAQLNSSRLWFLFVSTAIIFLISIYDDKKSINPYIKLALQFTIIYLSLTTIQIDYQEIFISNYTYVPLKVITIIVVYLWIFYLNATNFIDGVDGNLILFILSNSFLFLFLSYYFNYNLISTFMIILIIINLIAFIFNRFPAKAFLGDCGSNFYGFLYGWLFIIFSIEGFFIEILILNYIYFGDILSTWLSMIKKKQNIFVSHNNFLFKTIYKNYNKKNNYYLSVIFLNLILFFAVLSIIKFDLTLINKLIILLVLYIPTPYIREYILKKTKNFYELD